MSSELELLGSKLRHDGFSLTKGRQATCRALLGHRQLTMRELVRAVPDIDRASVYRTVNLFETLGIINRLVAGWKYKLELSDMFSEHHHHATCLQCGNILSIGENELLEKSIEQLGQSVGFKVSTHSLEIRGTCQTCTNKS